MEEKQTAGIRLRRAGQYFIDSFKMHDTDDNLRNNNSKRIWSNEDLDPVIPERRVWTSWNYAAYWLSESWGASGWSVGSSMVELGLIWWQAFLAATVGHLIGACLTVWNGRGGSKYHIGFPVWIRATFGPWGGLIPVAVRCVLDLVWFGIQTYYGGLFLDIVFQCIFGHHWTDIHNALPASADTTTRQMTAYFIYWFFQLILCFYRPHQIRWLFTFKAISMPIAAFGLFIWCLVRSGGPANFSLNSITLSGSNLGWTFLYAANAALNGSFGPLVASEPDITRYAKYPRSQIIGQLSVAPWSPTLVSLLGIIAAACTERIWGSALWNPAEILSAILSEDNSSATKFAVFLCAFVFMSAQFGTNFAANLIPFGVDASTMAPRHLNIVRAQVLASLVGGWCIVPWKVLTSGTVFISCITGMGIFMGCLVGIMLADYFFLRRGNYWIADLYTDDPNGRYWYWHGINYRAYIAYICGIALPFPGFLGILGVTSGGLADEFGPARKIYDIGYLVSFLTSGVVYYALCRLDMDRHMVAARELRFETMSSEEVVLVGELGGHRGSSSDDVEDSEMVMGAKI